MLITTKKIAGLSTAAGMAEGVEMHKNAPRCTTRNYLNIKTEGFKKEFTHSTIMKSWYLTIAKHFLAFLLWEFGQNSPDNKEALQGIFSYMWGVIVRDWAFLSVSRSMARRSWSTCLTTTSMSTSSSVSICTVLLLFPFGEGNWKSVEISSPSCVSRATR